MDKEKQFRSSSTNCSDSSSSSNAMCFGENLHNQVRRHLNTINPSAAQHLELYRRRAPNLKTIGISISNDKQEVQLRFFLLDVLESVSPLRRPSAEIVCRNQLLRHSPLHGVIRLLGVMTQPGGTPVNLNEDSVTVCCNVHGFNHRLYGVPELCKNIGHPFMEHYRRQLEIHLNQFVFEMVRRQPPSRESLEYFRSSSITNPPVFESKPSTVVTIQELKNVQPFFFDNNEPMQGCDKQPNWPVFQVETALPCFTAYAAEGLQKHDMKMNGKKCTIHVYGNNTPYSIMFLLMKKIRTNKWITLPTGSYFVREPVQRETEQQLEVDICFDENFKEDTSDAAAEELMPPIRIAAFKFKTLKRGKFAVGKCELIQAAIELRRVYNGKSVVLLDTAIVVGTCDEINEGSVIEVQNHTEVDPDATPNNPVLLHAQSERDLLLWWSYILKLIDPEGIAGFNHKEVDFLHAQHRIDFLDTCHSLTPRPIAAKYIGKMRGGCFVVSPLNKGWETKFSFHHENLVKVEVPGVFLPDVCQLYHRHEAIPFGSHHKMWKDIMERYCDTSTYEELDINIINQLHLGSDADRRKIAISCMTDTRIAMQFLLEMMPQTDSYNAILDCYMDLARLTGLPLRLMFDKSQEFVRILKNSLKTACTVEP